MADNDDDAVLAIDAVDESAVDRVMALADAHARLTTLANKFSEAMSNGDLSIDQLRHFMRSFDSIVRHNDRYLGTGEADVGPAEQQLELLHAYKGNSRKLIWALMDENREMQGLNLMLHMLPKGWSPNEGDSQEMIDRINLIVDRINLVQRKMADVLAPAGTKADR